MFWVSRRDQYSPLTRLTLATPEMHDNDMCSVWSAAKELVLAQLRLVSPLDEQPFQLRGVSLLLCGHSAGGPVCESPQAGYPVQCTTRCNQMHAIANKRRHLPLYHFLHHHLL